MSTNAAFSPAEYTRRLSLTRAAMQAAGLDAIFVTDPSNQAWLTGYDGWSFYVHQGVIVPQTGEPIWWGRHMDMMGGRRTCWMDHANILGYGDHYVQSSEIHPMQDLAQILNARGLGRANFRTRIWWMPPVW
jgi:ectoine hydrolase